MEISSLQGETERQCQPLPHHRVQPESCSEPFSLRNIPVTQGRRGVSPCVLAAAPSICSPKAPPSTPAISSATTHLCQHDCPQLAPPHSRVHSSVGCPTTQAAVVLTLEFRPGQRLQVTQLRDTTATSPCHSNLLERLELPPRKGHRGVHGLQSSQAPQTCAQVTGVQSR